MRLSAFDGVSMRGLVAVLCTMAMLGCGLASGVANAQSPNLSTIELPPLGVVPAPAPAPVAKSPEGERKPAAEQGSVKMTTGTVAKPLSAGGAAVRIAAAGSGSKAGGSGRRCTRLAFEVNDYGKEGPSRDAQRLLDKRIAEWTKAQGITKYTVGKKTVDCKLFIDLILFDEHTCRAEAPVCW